MSRETLWKYIVMPFMSGVVGWATNVLALEMTFKPIEYFGVEWFRIDDQPWGFFGWQVSFIFFTTCYHILTESFSVLTNVTSPLVLI